MFTTVFMLSEYLKAHLSGYEILSSHFLVMNYHRMLFGSCHDFTLLLRTMMPICFFCPSKLFLSFCLKVLRIFTLFLKPNSLTKIGLKCCSFRSTLPCDCLASSGICGFRSFLCVFGNFSWIILVNIISAALCWF